MEERKELQENESDPIVIVTKNMGTLIGRTIIFSNQFLRSSEDSLNQDIIDSIPEKSRLWKNVFAFMRMPPQQGQGQMTFSLQSMVLFGDFETKIRIPKEEILFSYYADERNSSNYEEVCKKTRAEKSGIVTATTDQVIDFNKRR